MKNNKKKNSDTRLDKFSAKSIQVFGLNKIKGGKTDSIIIADVDLL